jgi:hypothetical protein
LAHEGSRVLAGLGLSAFGPSFGRAQGAVPVLDTHLHPARNLRRGANLNSAIPTVLREVDQFGVSQAILLPPPFMNEEGRRLRRERAFVGARSGSARLHRRR